MAAPRVGVVGYGTIGRRVAEAVSLQSDMHLEGVVKTRPDYAAIQAAMRGIDIYVPGGGEAERFEANGIRVRGTIGDLLERVDVVVDATPAGVGSKYKGLYSRYGVRQVYQGGEPPEVAKVSFSSLCNYGEAVGADSVRVVSCNTTGLLRLICTLDRALGVRRVWAFIVRRAADPGEYKKGPINSIVLDPPKTPSHHARDAKTVLRDVDVETAAVVVPTTLMHVHYVRLKLSREASLGEVMEALSEAPRIVLLPGRAGIKSTAQLVEAARFSRPRADIPELIVFEESISVRGDEVSLIQAVHQESIVVPENIDAIRAVTGLEASAERSIALTDETLRIGRKHFFL
ncbi:MAG: type II glyceraldehyde-3-phosphate dehydrogenase [Desulfurococcales archaeon]|nr:type II glyceraldehyde-3-phosphate dehydrogenase [Desulfurococcales archaeon]